MFSMFMLLASRVKVGYPSVCAL